MKKNSNTRPALLAFSALFALSFTTVSTAGWKDLKNSLKKETSQVKNKAKSSSKSASNGGGNSSQPNPSLRNDVLKCDDVPLSNVQIGNNASYKVTEGLSSSNYTGFINRRPADVTNQCFVGVLQSDECVTMDVSEAQLNKVSGNTSNNLKMQCVYSDNPSEMATAEVPYKADNVSLKAMLLKCGHDQGDDYACDEGSNSTRAGIYKKQHLKGKVQLSVCGTKYHQVQNGSRHIYCQYYNKKTKKSIFAFEFNQTKD